MVGQFLNIIHLFPSSNICLFKSLLAAYRAEAVAAMSVKNMPSGQKARSASHYNIGGEVLQAGESCD
jgi:hypothetical protein